MVEIMMPEQIDTELDGRLRVSAKLKTLEGKFKAEAADRGTGGFRHLLLSTTSWCLYRTRKMVILK